MCILIRVVKSNRPINIVNVRNSNGACGKCHIYSASLQSTGVALVILPRAVILASRKLLLHVLEPAQNCQETLLHKIECSFHCHVLVILCKTSAWTHLIDSSKSARTQNLHSLQFRLLQDPQLSLVRGRPTGGQGFHQLTKETGIMVVMVSDLVSLAACSEKVKKKKKSMLLGITFFIKCACLISSPQLLFPLSSVWCKCYLLLEKQIGSFFVTIFIVLLHIIANSKQPIPVYWIKGWRLLLIGLD